MNQSVPEPVEGQSQLGVTTRGDGSTLQSRLYVFNDAGRCVLCLSPDDHAQLVTTNLSAGTYNLYGIGSVWMMPRRRRNWSWQKENRWVTY